jgi:hypothetical protein
MTIGSLVTNQWDELMFFVLLEDSYLRAPLMTCDEVNPPPFDFNDVRDPCHRYVSFVRFLTL